MNLYEIAEDAYLARAGNVSTNGIGAAVDAVVARITEELKQNLRTWSWSEHDDEDGYRSVCVHSQEEVVADAVRIVEGLT